MPRYDYNCEDCGTTFEVRASMADYSTLKPQCTACDSQNVQRSFAGLNVMATTSSTSSSDSASCCQPNGFG